ncbi:helix-turn-helix domain-containing protein [Mucilaginibacter sp. X4EP1]|uniref:helix-turn-helix domain-containing protein n=1 Tax=Mucilaginibacter sp. X4EP1 TaxID=2723092 RepID=UPI00216A3B24|nr:AraC family transcriptional regulator [Mucilaginibacter sp. X4EP1]MCS3815452.1 AraC-like DNA-binding protein [Mucilaginibacter sp. X4EP1]
MLLRSIILTGAINGLFFILLLKRKPKNSNSDRILMLWMAIISLQLGFYYDSLSASPIFPGYLQLLGFSLPLISSPVLYCYIRSLSLGFSFKWRNISAYLLPFVIFNCTTFFLHYTKENYLFLKDGFPHFSTALKPWVTYSITGLLALIPGYYTVLSFLLLLRHQKQLPNNYSYTEKINLNWLKWIVVSQLILFIGLFLFIKYGVNYGLVGYPDLFAVVGAILTIYVFFIGFCGLHQDAVFNNGTSARENVNEDIAAANYKNSGLNDEKADQIFMRLKLYMDKEQPFLKEDLSLAMLAGELEITSNQLSQVINQKSGSNFFNFINGYRVACVKDKFKDPALAHYSILGIAYDCGFRSKSSFNKTFKETTGQTPLECRKAVGP